MPGYRLAVRTLDFHSKKVGSIPSSLIMKCTPLRSSNKTTITPCFVIYSFYFISLFPPANTLLWKSALCLDSNKQPNQIFFKHSYLILAWLLYLKTSPHSNKPKLLKFVCLPLRRKSYTFQKAPMAHKTHSQEHFKFQFYKFKIRFKAKLKTHLSYATKIQMEHLSIAAQQNLPFFETNLLHLSHLTFTSQLSDLRYFTYTHYPKTKRLQ